MSRAAAIPMSPVPVRTIALVPSLKSAARPAVVASGFALPNAAPAAKCIDADAPGNMSTRGCWESEVSTVKPSETVPVTRIEPVARTVRFTG